MSQSPNCKHVQELLVRRSLEGALANDEQSLASEHMRTCPACRRFDATLVEMRAHMAVDEHAALQPDPTVAAYLRRRLLSGDGRRRSPARWLRDLVDFRIPAYQAALGVAAVSLVVFLGVGRPAEMRHLRASDPVSAHLATDRPVAIFTRLDTYEVLDHMRMLDRLNHTQAVDSLLNGAEVAPLPKGP